MIKQIATFDVLEDKIPRTMLAYVRLIQGFLLHVQLSSVFPDIVETDDIGMLD